MWWIVRVLCAAARQSLGNLHSGDLGPAVDPVYCSRNDENEPKELSLPKLDLA